MFEKEYYIIKNVSKKLWDMKGVFFRCGCFIVALFIVFVIFLIIRALLVYPMGWNMPAAHHKWCDSMAQGNSSQAIYWAKRVIYYDNRYPDSSYTTKLSDGRRVPYSRGEVCLSRAFEMQGDFEKALERYQTIAPERIGSGLDIARVLFKLGDQSKSFEKYCDYYQEVAETFDHLEDYQQKRLIERLYNAILCYSIITDSRKFRPFTTFHDFYQFMKKEYEQKGSPEEYKKVMKLFSQVDDKADNLEHERNERLKSLKNNM
ncbi:MAG: hypothetical protein LBE12_13120 [Planctomycetaceae bacterium]|jgi:hypothetical protein|nr:hypothetical protein [Planctomycetaceae bacterium]